MKNWFLTNIILAQKKINTYYFYIQYVHNIYAILLNYLLVSMINPNHDPNLYLYLIKYYKSTYYDL
jgi:hypothetical protein